MSYILDSSDPDYIAYNSADEDYLLRSSFELIRRWCGWHIAPSLTMTVPKLHVGSAGIIMLPSLYVTDVSEVVVNNKILEPDTYMWREEGYVQVPVTASWSGSDYGYRPGGYLPTVSFGGPAEVTLTHGYTDVPVEIKQVAFELASVAAELPPGNISQIQTPGFMLKMGGSGGDGGGGLSLTSGQRDRLSSFKLSRTR